MNILFTHSYFYRFDNKQWSFAQPYPPLGTITAAAYMREHGYNVFLHDTNLEPSADGIKPKLEDINPKYVVLYDDGFNYLTKMCLTTMREAAFEMIKMSKAMGATVIANSSDSTDHYKKYLDAGADYIIHGEGENTLLELITALESSTDTEQLLGISYKHEDEIIKNPGRPVHRSLDDFPMAAWDLIDIAPYRKIWMEQHGYFRLNLATTRGCPYKCNWCAKPIYGNRYNSRSPEHVIKEIQYLIEQFDVHHFWMCDDIFGLKPNWVQKFRDLKKEKRLTFSYKIQSRVDLMLQDDNLDALADSGAKIIWIGAESGSQKILDAMDKGTKVSQIYEAVEKLKTRNINVAFFLQFGYPTETYEDIRKTLKMVLDLMPDDIGISVSYPLPGTKFYDRVKHELNQKANWTDSDDLDLMFKNTYSPVFYKTLHRYVHNRYRIKKGWLAIKGIFLGKLKGASAHIIRMCYHIPFSIYHSILLNRYKNISHT